MSESVERFWVPAVSVLPVFILALVVEARVALPRRTKRQKREDAKQPAWVQRVDAVAAICFSAAYVLAMVLLVVSFLMAFLVLAGGDLAADREVSAISSTLVTAIIGASLTGLLPVARVALTFVVDRVQISSRGGGSEPAETE